MEKIGIKKRTVWKKNLMYMYIFSINAYTFLAENYHLPQILASTVPKEYTEYFLLIQSKTFTCSSPCVYFHAPLWKSVYVLVQVFPSTNQESKIIKTKENISHEQETALFSPSYQFLFSPFQCVALLLPVWGTWQQFFHCPLAIQSFLSLSLLLG